MAELLNNVAANGCLWVPVFGLSLCQATPGTAPVGGTKPLRFSQCLQPCFCMQPSRPQQAHICPAYDNHFVGTLGMPPPFLQKTCPFFSLPRWADCGPAGKGVQWLPEPLSPAPADRQHDCHHCLCGQGAKSTPRNLAIWLTCLAKLQHRLLGRAGWHA